MGTSVTFNGTSNTVPAVGDRSWGLNVTRLLISLAGNALAKSGGNFTLTADANFGANFGLTSKYFKSVSSNISTAGVVRLANNEGIGFRNAANSADLILKVNASNVLEFDGVAVSTAATAVTLTGTQTLTNKTLTAPVISSIVNTGTLTLPTSTDTLVGRATTDTLTNKTLTSPSITTPSITSAATYSNVSTPSTPSAGFGKFYFKADVPTYLDSAGNERVIANTAAAFANPMTTAGDIVYGGVAGAATRLAGAAGVLHGAVGAAPSFSTIVNADVSASAAIAGTKIDPAFSGNYLRLSNAAGTDRKISIQSAGVDLTWLWGTVSNGCYLATAATQLNFSTDSGTSNHMTISTGGAFTAGLTTAQAVTHEIRNNSTTEFAAIVRNYSSSTSADAIPALVVAKSSTTTGSSQTFMLFRHSGGTAHGYVVGSGTNTAVFATSASDERLKTNIQPLDGALAKLLQLKPVSFEYLEPTKYGEGVNEGFLAQNMEKVFPKAVFDIEGGYKNVAGWNWEQAYLVKAIQEQQTIIDALKARIDALEAF